MGLGLGRLARWPGPRVPTHAAARAVAHGVRRVAAARAARAAVAVAATAAAAGALQGVGAPPHEAHREAGESEAFMGFGGVLRGF